MVEVATRDRSASITVAAVQHDIVWEDAAATREHVAPLVRRAVGAGADLVVLTEMYATGFSMAPERVAEPPDGPSVTFLVESARSHGVWMAASVPVVDPGRGRPVNRLVLAGPAGELHHYDKRHPFTYSGEHEHYDAGEAVITVDVAGVRVTPFVCYDLRFADDFWGAAGGTDCYLVVANWPAKRREHWTALLRARAIENQAYVVGVNRVGEGGGVAYGGDSRVVDPLGEELVAAAGVETVLVAPVEAARVDGVRRRFPFLADRR